MSLPRYLEYKDSGVEWLGEVPVHWVTKPLKKIAKLVTGLTPPTENPENYAEAGFPWIRPEDIDETGQSTCASKYLSPLGAKQIRPIAPGASLICCIGTIGKVGIVDGMGSTNQQITSAVFSDGAKYGFYAVSAARAEFEISATGNVLRILNSERLGSIEFPQPPLNEQTAIAAFLDRETAKIDGLIAEQEKLITLLAEKRQATISHAVTKGLNPAAPMKDSGVAWLGEVPAHWTVSRLGRFATVENGTTPSRLKEEYWADGNVPWLASGEVNRLYINEASEFITAKALEECSLRVLPVETIIVGMIGQGKTRGMSAMLCVPASINQNLAAICPGPRLTSKYLLNIFHAVYEWLREAGRGGNQAAMNCQILSALLIPLPSTDEQALITAFIDAETAHLDALTAEATHGIALLKERRAALISAAVTGKIDVREANNQ